MIEIIRGKEGCEEVRQRGGIAVIVDALRASATITAFFSAGASEVIVSSEIDDAFLLKESFPGAVLAGERNFLKVPGFDLGNSPVEAASFPFMGRGVIFSSTSGAGRIIEAQGAASILIGSTVNCSAVARAALSKSKEIKTDIIIIPAGLYTDEDFIAEEDLIASVVIIKELGGSTPPSLEGYLSLIDKLGTEKLFLRTTNGKKLVSLGFAADVSYCARFNITRIVPSLSRFITLKNGKKAARITPFGKS
jgi:2-phosphosulfolactate phosphatase